MSHTITLTHQELTRRLDQARREGIVAGRVAERLGIGVDPEPATGTDGIKPRGVRPHLTIVPTDPDTAELLEFPNPTKKTAS